MEIKIGVTNIAREISISAQASAEEVEQQLRDALERDGGVLALSDDKGRRVLVPAERIGYVDLGQEHSRPVGFGSL